MKTVRVRLLYGTHYETDAEGVEREYRAPVVFESRSLDIAERWPTKFQRAHETVVSEGRAVERTASDE